MKKHKLPLIQRLTLALIYFCAFFMILLFMNLQYNLLISIPIILMAVATSLVYKYYKNHISKSIDIRFLWKEYDTVDIPHFSVDQNGRLVNNLFQNCNISISNKYAYVRNQSTGDIIKTIKHDKVIAYKHFDRIYFKSKQDKAEFYLKYFST